MKGCLRLKKCEGIIKFFIFALMVYVFLEGVVLFAQESQEDKEIRERYEKIGKEAIKEQQYLMRSDLRAAGKINGSDGRYFLSTDVIQFREIPEKIKNNILARRDAIKRLIWQVASDIESKRDTGVKIDPEKRTLSLQEIKRVQRLKEAIKENSISLRSLSLAIKMVVDISNSLYKEAIEQKDKDLKYNLYVEYTAFAYELSSIVIELIDDFKQNGKQELQLLYNERKHEVELLKGRLENRRVLYKNKLESGNIKQKEYDEKVRQFEDWKKALEATLNGWNRIFQILENQEVWTKKIKSKEEIFKDIRDDAGLQLDILAEIGIAREALSYFESIGQITEIAQIPLLPLNDEIVDVLLGLKRDFNIKINLDNN